jgi:hypothetical protein
MESRPVALVLPSPEQLGVTCARPTSPPTLDWTALHQKLDHLGATCFHRERLSDGGCRVTCLLATSKPGQCHRVEAEAGTADQAARLMLARAEEWAARK